jgi:hypothetical protein
MGHRLPISEFRPAQPTCADTRANRRLPQHVRHGWLCALLATFSLLIGGCAYRMGNGFESEIQSVYVPIFESQSDRRGLEFQLTEAVQKQIQLRTPFRVVDQPAADTQLIGKILNTRKRVLTETKNDDPRELQFSLTVQVRWENLKTGEVLAEKRVPISQSEIQLIQNAEFAPEVGQSLATAYQQVMDRMAREIVDLMEAPTL